MQYTLALAALATAAYAQQCTTSTYSGTFSLNPVNATSSGKRSIEERQNTCSNADALRITLNNGVLTDSTGRIGSIVANYQFQFDGPPPQAGAIYTSGFTICSNNTLASNGNALWYQCFDNTRTSIYGPQLTPIGGNCYPVYYTVIPCGSSSTGGAAVTTLTDGQPGVTSSACVPVTTLKDGQPVVSSCPTSSACVPITTLKDGQPVVSSCPTVAPTSTCVPVTTMKDGQPVVSSCPTAAPTSTCVPVTTMKDGQPVVSSCPTAAPTSTCVPVTTLKDGQPVVSSCPSTPTGTASIVATSVPSTYLTVNAGNGLVIGAYMTPVVGLLAAALLL